MADLMRIITERRSTRKYEDRPIPEEQVSRLLEAVRWAPSWANTQCWEVVLVTDPAVKETLQGAMPKGNPGSTSMVQAPLLVALCARLKSSGYYKDVVTTKFGDWFMFDLGLAAQNLCLAAHDMGLGTVILGMFDHNRVNEILGVPEGYEACVLIPVGSPAKISSAPKRRESGEFTHWNKF